MIGEEQSIQDTYTGSRMNNGGIFDFSAIWASFAYKGWGWGPWIVFLQHQPNSSSTRQSFSQAPTPQQLITNMSNGTNPGQAQDGVVATGNGGSNHGSGSKPP